MFKKILIACMAVMVFAIPIGASAEAITHAPYNSETNVSYFNDLVASQKQLGNNYYYVFTTEHQYGSYYLVRVAFSSSPIRYDTASKSVVFDGVYKIYETSNGQTYKIVSSSGAVYSPSYSSTFKSLQSNHTIKTLEGSNFFIAPPPPPKPVQIQSVKTVEEILPQSAAVAGGIVLVASIILGLWLLIGLVKRLVYSFLR